MRLEDDNSATPPAIDVGSFGQVFRQTLHPKMVKIDAADLSAKGSALSDGDVYRPLAERLRTRQDRGMHEPSLRASSADAECQTKGRATNGGAQLMIEHGCVPKSASAGRGRAIGDGDASGHVI